MLELLALGSQGVSAISGMANAYSQSQAIRAQTKYQKQQLHFNARLAEYQAQDALRRGEEDAHLIRRDTKRLIGSQRAALAGQGIELDSGSALDIQEETASMGAMDALRARNNAYRQAWGFRVQALDARGQAKMTGLAGRTQARSTILAGGLGAARDLGQGAFLYERYKTTVPRTDINGNAEI